MPFVAVLADGKDAMRDDALLVSVLTDGNDAFPASN